MMTDIMILIFKQHECISINNVFLANQVIGHVFKFTKLLTSFVYVTVYFAWP
jgi:hypothetical protein